MIIPPFIAQNFGKAILLVTVMGFVYGVGRHDGGQAIALKSERAMNDLLIEQQEKLNALTTANNANNLELIVQLTEQTSKIPVIIQGLRDAPQTNCSSQLISDVEWRVFRDAFTLPAGVNAPRG